MNETGRRRDFVGYGNSPPAAEWPNGARVAINVVINYEEGSEPSSPDSDAASEAGLTEGGGGGPRSEGNGAVSH
jgi:allantoinase